MRLAHSEHIPWSDVHGVHGAAGVSNWKQLVHGHALHGPWEAVELARIPAGGVSGTHHHTRTNELYFVLSGDARFVINETEFSMPAGHLAVTARGDRHGLRATVDGPVTWLVVEVPDTQPPGAGEAKEEPMKPTLGPVDLNIVSRLDLAGHGVSPLDSVGLLRLDSGEKAELVADDSEIFCYLVAGSATATAEGQDHILTVGCGATLTLGERTVVTATAPARLFWVRSRVEEHPS
ncbi:cupin domain-containing protein [Actinoplanes sp. NPDC026670]|uniref:cupin domain-containing protein n=1 Tax=Actinoplanes sp. NPDC026670 TaxID=3154700 RepID=UPI0033EB6C04